MAHRRRLYEGVGCEFEMWMLCNNNRSIWCFTWIAPLNPFNNLVKGVLLLSVVTAEKIKAWWYQVICLSSHSWEVEDQRFEPTLSISEPWRELSKMGGGGGITDKGTKWGKENDGSGVANLILDQRSHLSRSDEDSLGVKQGSGLHHLHSKSSL